MASDSVAEQPAPSISQYSKPCAICRDPKDVLIRCQIDDTAKWNFVCTGKCWREVSGGKVDGDDAHPNYRYGGMWKNKHEAVSAKKRPKKSTKIQQEAVPEWKSGHETDVVLEPDDHPYLDKKYTRNDRVLYGDKVWVCRKTHWTADASGPPQQEQSFWKEL